MTLQNYIEGRRKEFKHKLRSPHETLGLLLNSELAFPKKGETAGSMKERLVPHIMEEFDKNITQTAQEVYALAIEEMKALIPKEQDMPRDSHNEFLEGNIAGSYYEHGYAVQPNANH